MSISKSQYVRGLQCHKSLWLYKNNPELREQPNHSQESLFETGHKVGDLAKDLFPNGEEIEFDSNNFDGMIRKTKELISDGTKVIYEATFKEDGIFAMADILVRNKDGSYNMYEVKASTQVKITHIEDISIQWHALSKTIKLNHAYIVHINNEYTREGALDIDSLFSIKNVTEFIMTNQDEVAPQLLEMEEMLNNTIPDIDIGKHCSDPYDCDFRSHCWKHIPKENSVFDIAYAAGKQWTLYYQGIFSIDDVPKDFALGKNATLQIEHHKSQEIKIDKPKIKEFLDTIEYPINFFDFETFQNAIPRFDKQRPYAQMPFQYSLHIIHEDGTLEHKEFLGDENADPRESLAKQMLEDITATGSIVAYSQGFEKGKIRDLAELLPTIKDDLLALNERFVDIAHPFQKKHYYHPKFKGKYSIKIVLPTLFPNDDELDYKKLGSIQNGADAMDTFANLHLLKDKTKVEEIKKDLLAYCHLDTLAMVRLWEHLKEKVSL
ncbi:MAG: DUF2779 domain-containing protein [Sulfurovum sp.]|nr:DUF2779 domain-containing protein [Sulfurovum sp.]